MLPPDVSAGLPSAFLERRAANELGAVKAELAAV